MNVMDQRKGFCCCESGSVAAITALFLAIFLGLLAWAIDIGHLTMVKSEMQRAADAGALAGARGLLPAANDPEFIDWNNGKNVAVQVANLNMVDGKTLTSCPETTMTGYWDLTWTKETAPRDSNGLILLRSSAITPGPNDVPAVRVGVLKKDGANDGAVKFSFAATLGISE